MKFQKGSALVWTIIIIAILAIAGGIYFLRRKIWIDGAKLRKLVCRDGLRGRVLDDLVQLRPHLGAGHHL